MVRQTVFGMNVVETNPVTTATLPNCVATIALQTAVTIWVFVAIQLKYQSNNPEEVTVWSQSTWPLTFARYLFGRVHSSFPNSTRRRRPSPSKKRLT